MSPRRATFSTALVLACALAPAIAYAEDGDAPKPEALVPEAATATFAISPGPRPYLHRLSVSPACGVLGEEPIFALRLAYNPNDWLGYEASLGHNPGESVHAVLHTFSALVRHPLPGRFQPYGKLGYGMLMVHPGPSLNADPVTKNALAVGGGLEVFIRNDVALRAESQLAVVIGSEREHEGTVAYRYPMYTLGLVFFRTLAP